jgi:hypothetical protein
MIWGTVSTSKDKKKERTNELHHYTKRLLITPNKSNNTAEIFQVKTKTNKILRTKPTKYG